MTGAYRVTIDCGLCTAKVFAEHDDGDEADTLVEQQALAAGFIPLGKVSTAERRRASTWRAWERYAKRTAVVRGQAVAQ